MISQNVSFDNSPRASAFLENGTRRTSGRAKTQLRTIDDVDLGKTDNNKGARYDNKLPKPNKLNMTTINTDNNTRPNFRLVDINPLSVTNSLTGRDKLLDA